MCTQSRNKEKREDFSISRHWRKILNSFSITSALYLRYNCTFKLRCLKKKKKLHFRPTREARPIVTDDESRETYSGSGCSTDGSWEGRSWSEHLSQSWCRPTVPYTPHTEEVDPNRDSIVIKDSSTGGSFTGISPHQLVKWVQPGEKACVFGTEQLCCLVCWLMISNRNHGN